MDWGEKASGPKLQIAADISGSISILKKVPTPAEVPSEASLQML